jgi:preprotein translocase subunit SecD
MQIMSKYRFWAVIIIAASIWAGFFVFSNPKLKLGLDLSGGTHLVYRADISQIPSNQVSDSMNSLRDTIERRVNLFGVSEPIVQVEQGGLFGSEKEQRLIVELPGVTDVNEAIKKIGETPTLEFRLLSKEAQEKNKQQWRVESARQSNSRFNVFANWANRSHVGESFNSI